MTAAVRMENVSKAFRGVTLFTALSWAIEPGRTYGLIGPNGSGKSVLLKMMCGFVRPDVGTVTLDPRYLDARRTFPDRFGVAIDGPGYDPGRSAFANLNELVKIRGRFDEHHVRETLELVGLDPHRRTRARSFSQGMKQKLSLAQAFMEQPEVLLLDEPFNALDESSVAAIKTHIRSLKAEGVTIVFTSHVRADIDELCDEIWSIRNGTVVKEHEQS